jgi:CRP/FNR family transcriptional regulator, cyclic AMP receptor protein
VSTLSLTDRGRKLLEKCALFSSLDEKARHDIAAYAKPRNFSAGEPICRLGDRGDSMMAVVVGSVRISLPAVKGKEVILADLRGACMKLMEMLCARIRRSDERMADIAFFNLPVRLAKTLLNYEPEVRAGMKLSLSQSELAEMAGGTREKVNRCLREWQRQGIIELKNRWTIIRKPDVLRGLVEAI